MSKLIAAIANSATARPVLATAAALARPLQAEEVEAVHVRENGGSTAAEAAAAAGVPLRTLEPPVTESLVGVAMQSDVRAVVFGTRSNPTGPRPAGQVALALIGILRKPAVVVPPQAPLAYSLERILVPLDASKKTAAALRETIELARDAEVEIVVLHVLHGASLPLFSDQPQHEPEAWRKEFLARYCHQPERMRLETRVGVPAELVHTIATETGADLIALAWSQTMTAGRAAVVRAVLERSAVPVLLVPI
jgi:nucleotide-binding universal stress UspA family protein